MLTRLLRVAAAACGVGALLAQHHLRKYAYEVRYSALPRGTRCAIAGVLYLADLLLVTADDWTTVLMLIAAARGWVAPRKAVNGEDAFNDTRPTEVEEIAEQDPDSILDSASPVATAVSKSEIDDGSSEIDDGSSAEAIGWFWWSRTSDKSA